MIRIVSLSIMLVLMSGCSTLRVKTEVQEVRIPILYSPAPPVIERPILEIHQLTDAEKASDGRVAQAYTVTVQQLLGYIVELEQALDFYNDANVSFEQLQQTLRDTPIPNK